MNTYEVSTNYVFQKSISIFFSKIEFCLKRANCLTAVCFQRNRFDSPIIQMF